MIPLTGGSLFSGAIDGLGIAASLAGFDIRFHVEYDDWRRKVLAKHAYLWPHSVSFKDITEVTAEDLPVRTQAPRVDVLFGGFPCQDVSTAGNRAGLAEGTRSGLWGEYRRLISDLRPRAVVVENVTGLLTLGGSTVLADLAALGYVGRVGVISASDAGAPHQRDRVWIVAHAQHNRQQCSEVGAGECPRNSQRDTALCEQRGTAEFCTAESGGIARREKEVAYTNEGKRQQQSNFKEGEGIVRVNRYPLRSPFVVNSGGAGCEERHASRIACDAGHTARRFDEYRAGDRTDGNESGLGRNADGITPRLDGFVGFPGHRNQPQYAYEPPRILPRGTAFDRRARIEALGDAVAWPVAYPIFYYLHQYLQGCGE
jgi:DNA (cytosine-5)-methyltransferase 1